MVADFLVVGAGVIGLSTACHIKRLRPRARVLVIERATRICSGNSARSAALYRNLFSSSTGRDLAEASIAYYESISELIDLRASGYLWTWSDAAWRASEAPLRRLAREATGVELVDSGGLREILSLGEADQGFEPPTMALYGKRCGSLSPMGLAEHYARGFVAAGGEIRLEKAALAPVAGGPGEQAPPWGRRRFSGLGDSSGEFHASGVIVAATGSWLQDFLGPAGIATGVYPKKRQLFGVRVADPRCIFSEGRGGVGPIVILPTGQVYCKPILSRGIMVAGCADDLGRPFDLPYEGASRASAEEPFFRAAIEPVLKAYFPGLAAAYPGGLEIANSWAGHYDYYWPDRNPVIERVGDLVWVGGSSGSGIMKADSIGRAAAAKAVGEESIELFDGRSFRVGDLSLRDRRVAKEDLVI